MTPTPININLRCFCAKKPLLGVCGRDRLTGAPFVHVKVFKQGKVFGEMVAFEGTVHLRCRECQRWHKIRIRKANVDFSPEELPISLDFPKNNPNNAGVEGA